MIRRNSRCYNREQFIAKAKAIHGDLYDYSDTVLSGSQDPVSFKCNRCGTTRTLSRAGSHVRKIRPCGCKPCNHDRLSPCKICGVSVSSKVYHAQAKRCKACCDKAKQDRATHKESKHGKNCKTCGVWFVNRDRFYCTVECRRAAIAKPVECKCSNCKIDILRSPHNLKNPERVFCSKSCQSDFQSKHWLEYQKKSQDELYPTSKTKTKIARSKWANQRRLERRKNSIAAKWWSKCKEQTAKLKNQIEVSDWDRRCNSAASLLKSRFEPTFKLEMYKVHSWEKTISRNRGKLRIDSRTKEEIQWSKKFSSVARNCRRRFLAKNKNDTGCSGLKTKEAQQELLPFAE